MLKEALAINNGNNQTAGPARRPLVETEAAPKVAYIMSRFPKLTETFILYEMLAAERQGVEVAVYPLLRENTVMVHCEAVPFLERACFQPFISWSVLRANLFSLSHQPRAYLGALWALWRGTWRSPRFFSRALVLFPKAVFFARQMAAEGVTHVHAHFASHPAAAALVIHRLTGLPYSFTAHGSDIHRDQTMLREKVAEAAFVVPISDFNRNVILEACGGEMDEKLVVIHCGVDTTVFRPGWPGDEDEAGQKAAGRPFSILCIGTLHDVKGQKYLIEACRLLRDQGMAFTCRFVGDGPDQKALIKQVEGAGLTECIHFLGARAQNEVARLLPRADVVVAPSVPTAAGRREGIPVALMEAMACGVPVVASRLSGIPELVQDGVNGLLTPPGDSVALANALARLHDAPEMRRRLGREGRQTILRGFDLSTNVTALARRFTTEVLA